VLVSVIIATFNRAQSLENALWSISLQTYAPFEVIVANDGGADVSEIVARWRRRMSIHYIPLPENVGLARARNEALRRASGDIICFLDDDDAMLAGHIDAGVHEIVNGDADAAYTQVAVCDEFVPPGTLPAANQIKAHYRAAFDARLLLICNFMPVNAVFIRRRGDIPVTFDEELPHLEDWELWLRLQERFAYRFRAVPQATAVYHRVPGFSSMTSRVHASAGAALRFRDTFRLIAGRYPSRDPVVEQGRALHDALYGVLANSNTAFSYERFVVCMEAFVNARLDVETARHHIGIH
jgi:glycosyltransferase involved in cell wall biosynthesis